jgi:hypothetical protein
VSSAHATGARPCSSNLPDMQLTGGCRAFDPVQPAGCRIRSWSKTISENKCRAASCVSGRPAQSIHIGYAYICIASRLHAVPSVCAHVV